MSAYSYRRGSIFWALTLIAVGSIFLYQNFNPAIHPWQIIAKFWPIVIVFWGLSKLVDFLLAQANPDTTPMPLFSGSEVVLLILILIMGTIVSKVVLHPWEQWPSNFGINIDQNDWARMFMNSYNYTQNLSQTVKAKPQLTIEDQHGDLEIHGADQSQIDVAVKKVISADNENDAQKLADQVKIEIVEEGGHYVLRTNRRSLPDEGSHVRLDLTLTVPKDTSTQITSERGDATLASLQGDQNLTVTHGDAHLSDIAGLVRVQKTGGLTEVHNVKGSVEVDGRGSDLDIADVSGSVTINGDFGGAVNFRNVGQTLHYISSRTDLTTERLAGRLDMETGSLDANNIQGPFEISTRQKDITLENFSQAIKISNTNGDIQLRTSTPLTHPIDVNLDKGEIQLDIPPSSNFQIQATSHHGDVESDFPALSVNKEGDNPSISGANGKGGPAIHLSTSYGTIHVGHEEAALPAPPEAPHAPHAPGTPAKTVAEVWRMHSPRHQQVAYWGGNRRARFHEWSTRHPATN